MGPVEIKMVQGLTPAASLVNYFIEKYNESCERERHERHNRKFWYQLNTDSVGWRYILNQKVGD